MFPARDVVLKGVRQTPERRVNQHIAQKCYARQGGIGIAKGTVRAPQATCGQRFDMYISLDRAMIEVTYQVDVTSPIFNRQLIRLKSGLRSSFVLQSGWRLLHQEQQEAGLISDAEGAAGLHQWPCDVAESCQNALSQPVFALSVRSLTRRFFVYLYDKYTVRSLKIFNTQMSMNARPAVWQFGKA